MIPESFNNDWYCESTTPGSFFASKVGPIQLPHDAMVYETRAASNPGGSHVAYYPGGQYKYTKTFTAPKEYEGKKVTLEFQGVYHRSQVSLNGEVVGGRPYGYTTFFVELPKLKIGENNLIEVIANNVDMPNSRWYTGSGIYRPVFIHVGPATHIPPQGVRITTLSLDGLEAEVEVKTEVVTAASSSSTSVSIKLLDAYGTLIHPAATLPIPTSTSSPVTLTERFSLKNVKSWSMQSPYLHEIVVELLQDGKVIDTFKDTFGIRTVIVSALHGFQLNGQTIKLKGTCIHHDNGVIGGITLDVAEERRIRILKKAGYNAIRSAHNPANSGLLKACDKLGLVVMDELVDVWLDSKVPYDYSNDFKVWWAKDLESMISRDYNRPCVVMYSIGNEIGETAYERGIEQSKLMAAKVRELDPTRPSVNSINGALALMHPKEPKGEGAVFVGDGDNSQKSTGQITMLNTMMSFFMVLMPYVTTLNLVDRRTSAAFDEVDIAGYNYMDARYSLDSLKRHPNRVIVGSETSPGLLSTAWPVIESLPNVIGEFVWTAWDYLGEGNLGGPVSASGLMMDRSYPAHTSGECLFDITGHPETQVFINSITWGQSLGPFIAVRPILQKGKRSVGLWRFTDSVRSWSWSGVNDGKWMKVEVYAKAKKVTLSLNGKVIGTKKPTAYYSWQVIFDVKYTKGTLEAISYGEDGKEIGREQIISSEPDQLKLTVIPETTSIRTGGEDLCFIPIQLTDLNGTVNTAVDRSISVTVEDLDNTGTVLAGLGSGQAVCEGSFQVGQYKSYYGRLQAVLRSGASGKKGSVKVTVSAEGVKDVEVVIPVV